MTDPTLKALDRALRRLGREPRRRRTGSLRGPIYLTIGLSLGFVLLARFVPLVWSATLPGGLAQVGELSGLPGLIWRLGFICRERSAQTLIVLGGIAVVGLAASRGPLPLRFLVWLAAAGVILLDAGIVFVAVMTSLQATLR